MCGHPHLVVAEALTQDQPGSRVQDVGDKDDNLQETGPAHQAEQNHVPLDHVTGLQTHPRPQTVVVQVPWSRTEGRAVS